MWNRAGLKENAKENLRRFYWPAFLVCIISGIFNGGGSQIAGYRRLVVNFNKNDQHIYNSVFSKKILINEYHYSSLFLVGGIILFILLMAIVIAIAVSIFVGSPLLVGKNRYFMCNRDFSTGVGEIGYSFSSGHYWNVVKIMFLMNLYVFLWSLLLFIPGIIKAYEYAMIPYILAENPEIDSFRAFELSKEMMMGQKWNYFILQLSFIGWFLLGFILCGLGGLFVQPYYEATFAEFYGWARESMLAAGNSNNYELRGFGEGV